MSNMGFMEKLLEGVEVEWKALGEICHIASGGTPSTAKKEYWDNGDIPWLKSESCNNEPVHFAGNFLTELGLKNSSAKILEKNTTLIALVGATIFKTAYLEFQATTNQNIASIKSKDSHVLIDKFVFYYITNLYNYLKSKMRNYGMLNLSTLRQFKIPIPPPDIQAKIVRILDAFTAHTAELTAELTARKKQYNYYRDQLLTFEEDQAEWKTLGELCSINVGQAPNGNEIGEYPFVNAGTTPSGYLSTYNTEPDTITTPSRGQGGIGYVGYQNSHFWCGPLCYRIRSTNKIITTRFLYYVMSNSMINIIGLANMAGVPALNKKELVGFPVPIPPLTEQARIVAILDKFDALTHSITEGLPREIALRQQQYEYYRDLLLSFPKAQGEA